MANTREKLIELVWEASVPVDNDLPTVNHIVDHLVANDVVPVVRCRDCKYFDPNRALTVSGIWCSYWAIDSDPDDFCCKGERRSDGNL